MSLWWIGASSVIVVGAALVAAIAWRITSEVEQLTASVVALRASRAEVRSIHTSWVSTDARRWSDATDPRR